MDKTSEVRADRNRRVALSYDAPTPRIGYRTGGNDLCSIALATSEHQQRQKQQKGPQAVALCNTQAEMDRAQSLNTDHAAPADLAFENQAFALSSLTEREREVCILVAERGLTNKQIGAELFISPTTVRHHLNSIFGKLGISSRFELIVLCFRHRLVVPFENPSSTLKRSDR